MSTHISTTTVDHFMNSKFYDFLVFTKNYNFGLHVVLALKHKICFSEPHVFAANL